MAEEPCQCKKRLSSWAAPFQKVKNQEKENQHVHFPNASDSSFSLDEYFTVHYSSSKAISSMYMPEEQAEKAYHSS